MTAGRGLPDVAVVVPTRDRGSSVVATLDSIFANAYPRYEVILVDQSANQDTAIAARPFLADPRFRYVSSPTRGAASARNVGLALGRGQIVAFTDDDCVVPADWLSRIADFFAQHADVDLLFCNVVPAPHDASAGTIPYNRCQSTRRFRTVSDYVGHIGMSAGMAARRQYIVDLGGFDESLGAGAHFRSGEDFDLALRVLVNHGTVYETERVSVVHFGYRTLSQFRALSQRDWFAVGVVHAKYLKCLHWRMLALLGYDLLVRGICHPFTHLAHRKRPQGFKRALYLCQGFLEGWKAPVDPRRLLFSPVDGSR